MNPLPIVVTAGEPAGIGPDCVIRLASSHPELPFVVIADQALLATRLAQLNLKLAIYPYHPQDTWPPKNPGLYILHVSLAEASVCGQLTVANVPYVLNCIQLAVEGCRRRHFHAMVTGPVHKGIINQAGIAFSGHTEWIAELLNVLHPVMLLVGGGLRVALVTTHLPLKEVPAAITSTRLTEVIEVIIQDCKRRFGIHNPRILVCGLNPHAGEEGHLGREEIEVIIPTLQKLRARGMELIGPVPADTAFIPAMLSTADVVLAMYHDQGLPVIKAKAFETAVNMTLGLPIIRTSVDHGTALHLAGTDAVSSESLKSALKLAASLE